MTRERPSARGTILGEGLSDMAKAGDVGYGILSAACATCAFREGAMPNQMAATGLVALNCVLGIDRDQFACHHGMKDGEPTRICAGYLAAKRAPWPVIQSVLQTMSARLASLPDKDSIRTDFDAWVAAYDADNKLDDYARARAYLKASVDTDPKGRDAKQARCASIGSAVAVEDGQTPKGSRP